MPHADDTSVESIEDLADRYLDCRDFRHAWAAKGYWQGSFKGFYNRQLVCSRCRTVRIDRWEGGVVRRQYVYPSGYHIEGRVSAVDVRDERIRRVTVYKTQAEMLEAVKGKRHAKQQQRSTNVVDITDRATARRVARKRASVSR